MLLVGLTKSSKLPKIMHYRKKKKKRWLLVSAIILSWTWLVFSVVIHWTCWDLNTCPKHVKFWTYIRILMCLVHWYTWHKLNPSFTMYSKQGCQYRIGGHTGLATGTIYFGYQSISVYRFEFTTILYI